jgi:hypothetical protein
MWNQKIKEVNSQGPLLLACKLDKLFVLATNREDILYDADGDSRSTVSIRLGSTRRSICSNWNRLEYTCPGLTCGKCCFASMPFL